MAIVLKGYNGDLFSLNISRTRKKIYKQIWFLETTFYEENFFICLLITNSYSEKSASHSKIWTRTRTKLFPSRTFLIGLIGVIMFIYHGCDNLKHLFSDFIGRSGIQPIIELVFENVQVSSTFDFIWNIPYIDNFRSKKCWIKGKKSYFRKQRPVAPKLPDPSTFKPQDIDSSDGMYWGRECNLPRTASKPHFTHLCLCASQ